MKVVEVTRRRRHAELTIALMQRKAAPGTCSTHQADDLNRRKWLSIGPALAVLRIDSQGKLVEAKSKVGPATRFAADLLFARSRM